MILLYREIQLRTKMVFEIVHEREEALSKQTVLRVQKYEKEKVNESSLDAIIQSALSKKKNDRDATGTQKYIWPDDGESW